MSELTLGLTVIAVGTSLPGAGDAIAGVRKGGVLYCRCNFIGANILISPSCLDCPRRSRRGDQPAGIWA